MFALALAELFSIEEYKSHAQNIEISTPSATRNSPILFIIGKCLDIRTAALPKSQCIRYNE